VVSYFLLSFVKISRGVWVKQIFLNLRGLNSLVVDIVVNVSWPKAMPHFQCAPDSSKAYGYVLFKAFLYIIVR
jgi:hypothetical protein